jgi:hypothetical protein
MSVDRYTKVVLTVIAICLVWLSVGGPSLITPVSAQAEGVLLRGWVDQNGFVVKFPAVPTYVDPNSRSAIQKPQRIPYESYPLPMAEAFPR